MIFIILITVFTTLQAFAQEERCGTFKYEQNRKKKFPELQHDDKFENWLSKRIFQRNIQLRARGVEREEADIVQIPVVVHVIHNGETVGTGSNISDAQIISQIEVLTEDFRRTNTDASQTPPSFLPVAADVEMEFVLAKQDPEGLSTSGIVRVQGTQPQWALKDNVTLKALSYWPAENYLNIWVTDMVGNNLGYAQFPVSDEIPGLEDATNNPLTDGVVIDFAVFGSVDKGEFPDISTRFDKGRTTTHEVGHFFGLRHIWGDDSGSCENTGGNSDYCNDTPDQSDSTDGCPESQQSCESEDMFQNYMDYTDDRCMNLFTEDQKSRMRTILDFSPRRKSLKTSIAVFPPSPVNNDVGIREILSPVNSICSGATAPKLQIRNYGSNQATSVEVQFSVNGVIQEIANFDISLAPLEIQEIQFTPLPLTIPQDYTFDFEILQTNDVVDGNPINNTKSINVSFADSKPLPFKEAFNIFPSDWEIRNPDSGPTWDRRNAPDNEFSNTAMSIEFYEYTVEGEIDYLITPALDFQGLTTAVISMDIAYAQYPGFEDGLRIMVSTDCGNTFDDSDIVFEKFGIDLSSANSTTNKFIPSNKGDWKKECVDLSPYIGNDNVRIAFVGVNGYGNNIYLDNIRLETEQVLDIGIVGANSPSPVSCDPNLPIAIELENIGNVTINDFDVTYSIDGGREIMLNYNQIIPTCGKTVIELPQDVVLSKTKHILNLKVTNPNGGADNDLIDNSFSYLFEVQDAEDSIPYLETFDKLLDIDDSGWTIHNPDATKTWELYKSEDGGTVSAYINNFDYFVIGTQDWLISPTYDFGDYETARLVFDLSYAYSEADKRTENLRILLSRDCGTTFTETVFDAFGDEFSIADTVGSWVPTQKDHWKKMEIGLRDYAGENSIRLAFVVTNGNGNNLYIDNIELFTTDTPIRLGDLGDGELEGGKFWLYPNPSVEGRFFAAFDLEENQDVRIILYDGLGRVISDSMLENVLNQSSIRIEVPTGNPGMYMLRAIGKDFNVTRKVILQR